MRGNVTCPEHGQSARWRVREAAKNRREAAIRADRGSNRVRVDTSTGGGGA